MARVTKGHALLRIGLLAVLAAAAAAAAPHDEAARAAATGACPKLRAGDAYTRRVTEALRSGADVWGNRLLDARDGPTYEAARGFLNPLLFARAPKKRPLTDSGFHYVPFGQPGGVRGAGSVALHVADGSQVISQRVDGRTLTVFVGARGRERYGSCLARLPLPRLADGYLPILQTRYADARGARYTQESFAARIPETRALVSFVRVTVDARGAGAVIRFTASGPGRGTFLAFSPGGRRRGSSLTYTVPHGAERTVYVAWPNSAARSRPLTLDAPAYEAARRSVAAYWERRLAEGMTVEVPERRVADAVRALLVQNLNLTWRYSIGNAYEQFSFPESVDVAQVMGEYGHAGVARSILRTSLTRKPTPYPNWKMGEKLVGSASYYRLFRDRAYVEQVTPALRRYVETLGRQLAGGRRLLGRERYSSDIAHDVYGVHSQAVVWQGLRELARVWQETGHAELAARCRTLAARLEGGLRQAVASSQRRLPEGSLFVPVRLLDGEPPYGALTSARLGSYWNLVMPYALASGLFAPGSAQAEGVLRYLLRHGSRLLGLVRAGAYALYRAPRFPTSGTDEVYGINVARFLADNDEADQLVLSLYGQLAAAMTPGTFVSGEAVSVAPLDGAYYRATYLPPNGASNAAFLEKLRLMLVHETRDSDGAPRGLELAFATPRRWLRPGGRIALERAPTSFGPISYALEAAESSVRATISVPARSPLRTLKLRLRLPRGNRIASVLVNGRAHDRFDAGSGTIDLSGRTGALEIVASYGALAFTAVAEESLVRTVTVRYRAHNGIARRAHLLLPASYGPRSHPPIPLIISPHGRGVGGRANLSVWGDLPARGWFAVVSPDGQGRRLSRYSWGFPGQVEDLARMPQILRRALPWLNLDGGRVYAFGGSMGGQEALLLLARHPRLLAGVAVFDSVVDLAHQYRRFPLLPCGRGCQRIWGGPLGPAMQKLARVEIGGSPLTAPAAYAARSPLTHAAEIAFSCVPLQIWWSVADRVVGDQERQSRRLFWTLRELNPVAPVSAFVGFWIHSAEMHVNAHLPLALASFNLLPEPVAARGPRLYTVPAPSASDLCAGEQ